MHIGYRAFRGQITCQNGSQAAPQLVLGVGWGTFANNITAHGNYKVLWETWENNDCTLRETQYQPDQNAAIMFHMIRLQDLGGYNGRWKGEAWFGTWFAQGMFSGTYPDAELA